MAETRITKRYLRLRSGIALAIVLTAWLAAMFVAFAGRDGVARRAANISSIDTVILSLSELSVFFLELKMADQLNAEIASRGHLRRASHAAAAALEKLSHETALDAFSPGAATILQQRTYNPLLELEEIIFIADLVSDPSHSDLYVSRAAGIAADLSLRLMPIYNRIRQEEIQAGEEAADKQLFYGLISLAITLLGIAAAAKFVHLPMERYVIRAQSEIETNRRSAEAASEAKSMFLATMSHEIRTPLNGVIGLADVLERTDLDSEQKRMVSAISSSGNTLLQLINDVLDLAKIDAGKQTLDYTDFDLHTLCCETAALFSGQAQKNNVHLKVVPAENGQEWFVHGAANAVRQILANLVGNAVKFTDNGTVTVELQDMPLVPGDPRSIRLSVRDEGIGIPRAALERVFDQFEQADTSTTTQFGGTGLGLAIVKRLTELMGGSVSVSSVENEGSEFFVTFPVAPAQKLPELTEEVVDRQFFKRVLVADDNRVNRLVARKLLETLGCEIATAANGAEAVELAKSWEPDLILMDVRMPVMDGLQATQKIRTEITHSRISNVPIVGLSANTVTEHRESGIAAGMDGYLQKPINRNDLMTELAKHWPHVDFESEALRA